VGKTHRFWRHGVAALFAVGFTSSSLAEGNGSRPPETSFKADVQPLFDTYCVACHQSGAAQQGLVLEEGLARARIVGKRSEQAPSLLVKPGDPGASYLLHKIGGTHLSFGGSGTAMPPGGPIEPASIALVRSWIAQGAKDN
jgi:mono/diheme cytochrome c family protein